MRRSLALLGVWVAVLGFGTEAPAAEGADDVFAAPGSTQLAQADETRPRRGRFRRGGSRDEAEQEAQEERRAREDRVLEREAEGAPATDEEVMPALEPIDPMPRPPATIDYEMVAVPDRWRIVEDLGVNERWWDPYNQNTLKADRPILGTQDWFVNFLVLSDLVIEPRSLPTPFGTQVNAGSGANDAFGGDDQLLVSETLIASFSVIQGDTAFRPPDLELRVSGAGNANYTRAEELGTLYANPERGRSRTDWHFGFTELFVDKHLYDKSARYDFDSVRVGVQAFSSDFRGFLYADNNLGARLFGNFWNNRMQYNLAWFRRIEKDTNSGLPKVFDLREDDVALANLYYQDFPVPGFTLQGTVVWNHNTETGTHRDQNGFQRRPAPVGDARSGDYDTVYFGLNGDGHFDRLNLTFSLYYATGHADHDPIARRSQTIDAWFLAAEASYDLDWWRAKIFGLFVSGDEDPEDGRATGFDTIFDNPQFAGAETSYWQRQSIPLIFGGGVVLTGRNSFIPSLRSSKEEGQANFVNPGLGLIGVGAEFDVLPELRVVTHVSYLRFVETGVLENLRQQRNIDESIGTDLSLGLVYRPLMTQNIVLRASAAMLVPDQGLKDLYPNGTDDPFYSVLLNLVLAY